MKRAFAILFTLFVSISSTCFAIDNTTEELLSWLKLSPKTTTPANVTSLLGKPGKVEENKKRTLWHYTQGNSNLVISWNNKSDELEKFCFKCSPVEKGVFDTRISTRLKSGTTNIMQAVKILGIPRDMTIRSVTQEMHYSYKNSVLRLFFRNGTLVDYTLLSQQS